MFCIVRCNRCGALQGASYPISRSRCRACNGIIDLQKDPPLGTFERNDEMREVLVRMRTKVTGGTPGVPDQTIGESRIERRSSALRNREAKTILVLQRIGDGTVLRDDLERSCKEFGIDDDEFELIIDALIEQRLVYRPRTELLSRVK